MRILLTGGTGQLGWELQRTLAPLGELIVPTREEADLRNSSDLRKVLHRNAPDLVINAAAFTDVDRAEEESSLSRRVNAKAPSVLADEAKRLKAKLIHFSTDYVFDGSKRKPYHESDEPAPVNTYGRNKLEGEKRVMESGVAGIIIRLSWLYGLRRTNFVTTMLRMLREQDEIEVVADQWGSPTWSRTVAEVTAHLIVLENAGVKSSIDEESEASRILHVAARGEVSRFEQARAIQKVAANLAPEQGFGNCELKAIESGQYPQTARRPPDTALSADRCEERYGLQFPDWRSDLERCLEDFLLR